jgi:hypothetical protein
MLPVAVILALGGVPGRGDHEEVIVIKKRVVYFELSDV